MRKTLITLLIILLITSIGVVGAGNNTTEIENPTITISDAPTIKVIESGDSNISFEDGYKGYCAEWSEHSAEEGQEFYIEDTAIMNNSNYLKTMFLFFYNQTQKDIYATQHMIWKFTDNKQFSKFNQTWYNQIVETGDKYTIPDEGKIPLNDTHQMSFSFKAFIAQINEYQNYFAYKFFIEQIPDNSTIEINNSTTNNSIIILPNYQNNNSSSQYDGTYYIDEAKNSHTSTFDKDNINLNKNKTGINIWALILMLMVICGLFIWDKKKG